MQVWDITARRYFMNVNGSSVVIHEQIWWVLLPLSMFPVYSSQVSWCRSQLDRVIENHQQDKQTHTLLIRRRFGRVLEWSSYDRWYWVAKKGVPSFPVEAPLGSGVVTNARHRKPSLSLCEKRKQTLEIRQLLTSVLSHCKNHFSVASWFTFKSSLNTSFLFNLNQQNDIKY